MRYRTLFITLVVIGMASSNLSFAETTFKTAKELETRESTESEDYVAPIARPTMEYSPEGLRDPLREFENVTGSVGEGGYASSAPDLIVQGIVYNGNFPQAIINDKVVKEGDIVNDIKIISINKEGVTVSTPGGQYLLTSPITNEMQNLKKKSEGGTDEK